MRRRFTSATVALIAVIEVVAIIGWWQVGEVRSHARNSAAIHSLTQYVNLVGSEGFRVAYDPDPDERDEARGILSIALGQLARIYINLSGTAEGLPVFPQMEGGDLTTDPDTGSETDGGAEVGQVDDRLDMMREEAEKEYNAAQLPQYLAEDRENKLLRLIWTTSAEPSGSGATAEGEPSLKEQIAELAVIGASLLDHAAMSNDELLDIGRKIEILSVLEISPRLNSASAALEQESTRIFTRLLVLGGISMLAMLTAVIGCLFWILLPMERRVTAAQDSLEQANTGLEQTVSERTSELEAANRTLRSEFAVRVSAETALKSSEKRFRNLFESGPISIREEDFSHVKAEIDALGIKEHKEFLAYLDENPEFLRKCADLIVVVDANRTALKMHGIDDKAKFLRTFTQNLSDRALNALKLVLIAMHKAETLVEFETSVVPADGHERVVMARWSVADGYEKSYARILFTSIDITESRQTEERLKQAQKMEAVGQLTGGVAHDFNNLLAVIGGNVEMLGDDPSINPALTAPIVRAVKRGAELTQRLLAFSRQQPLRPQVIEIGELVTSMSGMLNRALGETIELDASVSSNLWDAMADPGQVENALLNLAINARDAMPNGGKLTIECANTHLDEATLAENADAVAGDFVVLAVSDDGTGMTDEVKTHAFEPFFTTKEVGEGSGLGLSMVYGFAKQSGGHVSIYSEVGKGTTVKLYLPRAAATGHAATVSPDEDIIPRGQGEVILVIEDDPDVRALAVMMLESLGYKVIDVGDAAGAHKVLADNTPVDLILSDVVLPGGISGLQFAEEARVTYPGIKIIFMSGYPAEAAMRKGFLGADDVLLTKPFERRRLARTLRDQID